jgi:hypothetical protein
MLGVSPLVVPLGVRLDTQAPAVLAEPFDVSLQAVSKQIGVLAAAGQVGQDGPPGRIRDRGEGDVQRRLILNHLVEYISEAARHPRSLLHSFSRPNA